MPLRETIEDVARLADLAALDRNVRAEGAPDRLAQGFRAVDDEEMAALGVEASLYQIVEERLNGGGVLGRALDDAQRMLGPPVSTPTAPSISMPSSSRMCRPSI